MMRNMAGAKLTTFSMLFTSMLGCGLLSCFFGKELCWDLANYHYYGPFAFFNHRDTIDYWPVSFLHQFLNPTLDFLSYFLINHFQSFTVQFLLGALHGINAWLLFLIGKSFVRHNILLLFIVVVLGMYGPTALPAIGSFQNDHLISLFVLSYVWLQLQALAAPSPADTPIKWLILAGFFLGMGAGLKLTAGLYALGGLLALLTLPLPFRKKSGMALSVCLGIVIGILATAGHWMWHLWQIYSNPVFPFLNNIFQSDQFALQNWRDLRFMPQTLVQTVFFPFYFSWDGRISDVPFRDIRFLILYALTLLTLFKVMFNRHNHGTLSLQKRWLTFFFISSYIVWQYYFSIARYLLPLEMLAPLLIYLLVEWNVQKPYKKLIITTMVFYSLIFFMLPQSMVRARWFSGTFFNVELPPVVNHIQNATVLTAYPAYVMDLNPRPQSYLIPFFPRHWQFIGIPFQLEKYAFDPRTHQKIASKLIGDEPVFLLTSDQNMPELKRIASLYGLISSKTCARIKSDRQAITHQYVLLCQVR
ncbi:MAG: hypothetical protein H0W64_03835 [Gammaproteobacteria bacterium]|nr:hypothetical protein [Gammaproteobacteria bacterium]